MAALGTRFNRFNQFGSLSNTFFFFLLDIEIQINALFPCRYFINSTWYKPGGPVFLMIGGEGEASPKWMIKGAWLVYAEYHNAMAIQVEHRFYGKSHPLP